jgi:hypothetical protein
LGVELLLDQAQVVELLGECLALGLLRGAVFLQGGKGLAGLLGAPAQQDGGGEHEREQQGQGQGQQQQAADEALAHAAFARASPKPRRTMGVRAGVGAAVVAAGGRAQISGWVTVLKRVASDSSCWRK